MTQASIETYIRQEQLGELKRKRQIILNYIIRNPDCHLMDIKRDLKMIHQSASSVVSVLKFDGKIFVSGTKKVPSGTNADKTRTHSIWRYEPSLEKQSIRNAEERLSVVNAMAKRMANEFPDLVGHFNRQVNALNKGEEITEQGGRQLAEDIPEMDSEFMDGQMELF